jgi:cytochrome P450
VSVSEQVEGSAPSEGGCPVDHGERGCPVVHEEFFLPRGVGEHWALGDRLREQAPVYWNTQAQGYWMFSHFDAVRDIYRQPELFSSESITPWDPNPAGRFIPTMVDEPDHMKYRKILNPWFTAKRVKENEDRARAVCRRLVEQTAPLGQTNFVQEFALRYPTEVFLGFVGMDLGDADDLLRWVEEFFSGYGGDPATQQRMGDALQSMRDYWVDAIAERRGEAEPREGDFASYLLHARFGDERPLTEDETIELLRLAVIGGLDTTRGSLGYMFRHLAMHPDDRRRLVEEPELIPLAVDEALRFYTITFGDGRKVTRDAEFHGAQLKKGDMVWGLVAAANRDPRAFDRANEFIVDRKSNRQMGFGLGPHRCLGLHLARSEMKIAVEEWLRVIPDFWVGSDEVLMERGAGSMLSPLDLPLAWK